MRDPFSASETRDLLEILDDCFGRVSTLVASQVPADEWFSRFLDPTHADAILDRVIHNAYRLNLTGDSQRKVLSPHPHVVHLIYNSFTSVASLRHWTA